MFPSLGNEVGGDADKEYQTYLNRIPPGLKQDFYIFKKSPQLISWLWVWDGDQHSNGPW